MGFLWGPMRAARKPTWQESFWRSRAGWGEGWPRRVHFCSHLSAHLRLRAAGRGPSLSSQRRTHLRLHFEADSLVFSFRLLLMFLEG